jgi:hypothetical protein
MTRTASLLSRDVRSNRPINFAYRWRLRLLLVKRTVRLTLVSRFTFIRRRCTHTSRSRWCTNRRDDLRPAARVFPACLACLHSILLPSMVSRLVSTHRDTPCHTQHRILDTHPICQLPTRLLMGSDRLLTHSSSNLCQVHPPCLNSQYCKTLAFHPDTKLHCLATRLENTHTAWRDTSDRSAIRLVTWPTSKRRSDTTRKSFGRRRVSFLRACRQAATRLSPTTRVSASVRGITYIR